MSNTIRDKLLPVAVAVALLIVFNVGLYTRLAASPLPESTSSLDLPYQEDFTQPVVYSTFGGDWAVRDETYVQISPTGFDLGAIVPLEIPAKQPYRYAADLRYIAGSMGGGLLFNVQGQTRQQSQMVRFNVDEGVLYLIWGIFGEDSNFEGQGSLALETAPDNDEWQRLGVLVDENSFRVMLNGGTVTDAIPLTYHGGSVGVITSGSQVAFDNLSVEAWDEATPANPAPVATDSLASGEPDALNTLLFTESFDDAAESDSLWQPIGGTWQYVTGALRQTNDDGFDYAIGYERAISGDYRIDVTLQHLIAQGGGVLFNMAQPDSKASAHMVRYVHDADFLMWGWFDADSAFNAQGSVPVSAPEMTTHRLSVTVTDDSYTIVLDDEILTTDVAVEAAGEYIGLVSAQSAVAFDEVRIYNASAGAPASPETTPEATTFNALTGDWTFGETIIQRSTEPVDYIAGTGIAAETFRMSVDIALPADLDDAGAGVIFHMSGRDDIAKGQMVRFGSGGDEIFWGSYDDAGVFTGMGGAPLNLDWSQPHTLTLIVRAGTYDILVNETTIVNDLPVQSDFGWLGLLSYRGDVTFTDFELSIGG